MYVGMLGEGAGVADTAYAAAVRLRRRRAAGRGAARVREDLRRRDPRGLRAVGDLAGGHVQPPRPAQARLDRPARSRAWSCGWCARRRRDPVPARRGRRDRDPRAQRDEGLLEPARGDRGGDPRRLVPHRRPGPRRRRRLLLHRRPQEGHDHPRRLQRLPAGDRGGALRAPGGARGRGDRRPAPHARRGGRRRRRAAARRRRRHRRSCATA